MTEQDFKAIKATFPWKTRVVPAPIGGLVQIINCHGQEVPIFTMTELLEVLTNQMSKERAATE